MKQQIKTTEAIFPMPVLLISTFNDLNPILYTSLNFGCPFFVRKCVKLNEFCCGHKV